jgi:hypothetical protein
LQAKPSLRTHRILPLPEPGTERGELGLWNPDHDPEKLLLSDRALMSAGADEAGEVLTEGADAGEVALRDLAPQLPQAAGVLGGEDVGRDTARRRLDGRRGRGECEGAGCGECEGSWASSLLPSDDDGRPRGSARDCCPPSR